MFAVFVNSKFDSLFHSRENAERYREDVVNGGFYRFNDIEIEDIVCLDGPIKES